MAEIIEFEVGDILKHRKGGYYRVLTFARHTEQPETLIVYVDISSKNVWARPLSMFTDDRFTVAVTAKDLKECGLDLAMASITSSKQLVRKTWANMKDNLKGDVINGEID